MRALALLLIAIPAAAAPFRLPHTTRQLVVVVSDDWGATTAKLERWERDGRIWKRLGGPVDVTVGYTGLAWGRGLHGDAARPGEPHKQEGDGRAPAGVFRLRNAVGAAPQPHLKLLYRQATARLRCVDDPESAQYNRILDAPFSSLPWTSDEVMLRSDGLYDLVIVVEHNTPAIVPGAGSCIFLHTWSAPGAPTVGCTAMARDTLDLVAGWLDREANPLLVQLPGPVYRRVAAAWGLP